MKILVLNSGSSSIKFQLISMETKTVVCRGLAERIGLEEGAFHFEKANRPEESRNVPIPRHKAGVELIRKALMHPENGVLQSIEKVSAIGHRMVHGGTEINDAALMNEEVVKKIHRYDKLAPLHNPPTLMGYEAAKELFPGIPHVGVFDTAFHATLPEESCLFPIPYTYYENSGIRRYGYHGTSHKYVTLRCAELLGKPPEECNFISCHLGNGGSITAVREGKSVDTSLGFGTSGGIPMGTRAGDLDPDILLYLMENEGMSVSDIRDMVYKKSGLFGMSGISNDARDIQAAAEQGSRQAALALDAYAHFVRKCIGGMATNLGGRIDAVIFTAGIGENAWRIRQRVCAGLEIIGARIDPEKNRETREEAVLSRDGSPVKIFTVPTNEELMIAMDTERIVRSQLEA